MIETLTMGLGAPAIPLTTPQWYLLLGTVIGVVGTVRLLLTRDLVARLIAMNVVGVGSLLILVSLGARNGPDAGGQGDSPDPVLSALVITGLVITVAFTGLGAVLIRRIEGAQDAYDAEASLALRERPGQNPADDEADGIGSGRSPGTHEDLGSGGETR